MTMHKQVNALIHLKGCIARYLFEPSQSGLCGCLSAAETDQQRKSSNGIASVTYFHPFIACEGILQR
jgi:hypothetical protein